jgi:hypothetical protein
VVKAIELAEIAFAFSLLPLTVVQNHMQRLEQVVVALTIANVIVD